MAFDLKIVRLSSSGAIVGGTWPNPDFVDGEYNLVQRIVKNLMTDPGDDMFDPDWGSGLRQAIRGIPGQDLGSAKRAVTAVLIKCRDDIMQSMSGSDPASRLRDLLLESIEYDLSKAGWVCLVTVVTEANASIPFKLAL